MPIQSHIITLAGENMYPSLLIVVCIIATKHTSSGADLGIFCKKKRKEKKGILNIFNILSSTSALKCPYISRWHVNADADQKVSALKIN